MISQLEREVTFRFLRTRKNDGFLNIISIFSFIGISLGVAVLIIVMSVMNGFRTELISKIVGFNAHAVVQPGNKPLTHSIDADLSKNILSNLGYNIPLAWERGYHHHFSTKKKISINPAIYDVEGGFVYSSNGSDVRVTSGVELTFLDAVENEIQINESIQKLRKIIPLNKKLIDKPWLGSRPTIIDSLPMIGKAPKHKNLWFNFGHNHIGLSTSAGSAVIISEMIQNKKTSINADPFSPKRFSL